MCDKLPYCNPRIDKCLISIIDNLNKSTKLTTLASCCGHGIYNSTIVVKDNKGNIFEYYSNKPLNPKKRNRYYRKDNNGFYFIPEVKMKMESEKERIELIRPYCSKCKSPMHPRYGYYRCFNCGNKRYFTEKEQLFWEKEERSKPRSN